MVYQLQRPDVDTVISYCKDLLADEKLEVYEFGENSDLVLHIYKDGDYDPDRDSWNIVRIHTAQDGRWVDDTGDIHICDEHILRRELTRIGEYRDFGTY